MISPGLLDMDRIDFISVLNRLDDGVIIADAGGVILFYNTAQSKIDGISSRDAIGLKVTDIYELNNRTSMIMQVIRHQAPIKNRAFFYRTTSGKVANTITSVYPLFNQETFNGVICLVKDYELLYRSTPMTAITECRSDLGNGTQYTFADLIGSGRDFQRVVATARKAASSASPIMIQGETGTGKELVAQSIHNESLRRREKYVAVNCAAIPHDLLEGMLFGTTRGAFTGALNKPGLFEIAHRGTLFLDELLAMPVDLQAKLLRALQEKCIRRLGSAEETRVDVKIISSVSLSPRKAVRENRLRTDLFYRLAVVMVKLPALRNRQICMQELVRHFIEKYNSLLGTQVRHLSDEVFDLFSAYQWPGNIRELEHLIEGAMNLAGYDDTIGIKHFSPGLDSLEPFDFHGPDTVFSPPGDMEPGNPKSRHLPDPVPDQVSPWARNLALDQSNMEKSAVKAALYAARGNVTKAAKHLCISRQLFHYKMKKHGFSRLDFV
jgi:arginine utilization regulatory protein